MRRSPLPMSAALLTVGAFGTMATGVAAKNPYAQDDESWISLDGTVRSVMADRFELDYGSGWITVEMDDGDRDADAYQLMVGDEVTVSGRIDDDLFETATIEASSVYVENLGTYFTASAVDEEDAFVTLPYPIEVSRTVLQGTVTEVDDEEFKIVAGTSEITVEVEDMSYNPLDDEGYQQIEVGDYVSVVGYVDYDLLEGREIVATSVVTIASESMQ